MSRAAIKIAPWSSKLVLLLIVCGGCITNADGVEPSPIARPVRSVSTASTKRPNILWITAEDMSPVLGCYGDPQAITPHLDRLARQSVRFTHVFATAPVCSPVRSTLITGRYAPSMGTHNMRSGMPLPGSVRGFPALLREAGYYTCNNSKTDYNTRDELRLIRESWNESSALAHWRKRSQSGEIDAPFFAVFNLMTSHQSRSMVWPYKKFQQEVQSLLPAAKIHEPEWMTLPPWYPDTSLVRRDWARFYDCVSVMDQQVGQLLQQLQHDGLADDTIVFFFSDHGSGMPRYKRALLDSGMHVPLLVQIPERWQHLWSGTPGSTDDRMVSFVDLPPTVLQLAGVPVAGWMQGRSLTQADTKVSEPQEGVEERRSRTLIGAPSRPAPPRGREYAFGHRDRVDEAFDCARSIRSRTHLLILNFMPQLGYHQPSAWPDQGQIRQQLSSAAKQPGASASLQYYTAPRRPRVELYNCESDPQNLNNLAGRPDVATVQQKLHDALTRHLIATKDLGFVPEPLLHRLQTPSATESVKEAAPESLPEGVGQTNINDELIQFSIQQALHSLNGTTTELPLLTDTGRPQSIVRDYWAAVGLRQRMITAAEAAVLKSRLRALPSYESPAALHVAALLTGPLTAPAPNPPRSTGSMQEQSEARSAGLKYLLAATERHDLDIVLAATRELQLLNIRDVAVERAMTKLSARTQRLLPTRTTATFVQSPQQDLAMFINFSASAYLQAAD